MKTTFLPMRTSPIKKRNSVFRAKSWLMNSHGQMVWVDPWNTNILHDQGEQYILARSFDTDWSVGGTATTHATLYIGLDKRDLAVGDHEDDDLTDIQGASSGGGGGETELTGAYARQPVSTSTGFTMEINGTFYQVRTSTPVSFTATTGTGAIASPGGVRNRFLASSAYDRNSTATHAGATAGILIASIPFQGNAIRTINEGDTLNTSFIIGLTEPA